jgi:hypothetical protein
MRVLPLSAGVAAPPRTGRPRKLRYPPIPQEVLDGMTALEREHFDFFIDSIRQDYQIKLPSDQVALYMAALEYVNLLRVQAHQLKTGEVITAARQHPGVQLRAWLDSMAATRAKRGPAKDGDDQEQAFRAGLSKLAGAG